MNSWEKLMKIVESIEIVDESPVGGGGAEDGESGAPEETEVEETY